MAGFLLRLLLLLLLLCASSRTAALPVQVAPATASVARQKTEVLWMAPFFSGGGYCSEAIAFATALAADTRFSMHIAQHGDSFSPHFVEALPEALRKQLVQLARDPVKDHQELVVVCHSEPGAWYPPKYQTARCPPTQGALARIGRTMFETDRLPAGWEQRLNKMDQVWVPSSFHARVFVEGGVQPDKVVVMPEPVDVEFFDPDAVTTPLALPKGVKQDDFVFLSIFKWEQRKGWNFLLEAMLREFRADEAVSLLMLTNAFHGKDDFQRQINEYVKGISLDRSADSLARVVLLPARLPTTDMPALYKAADAFVLPSRGEGWGRPHAEAMSMQLPVIATNWSGTVDFMSEANSYPLRIDGLDVVEKGPFAGHYWARPSLQHLRQLMRDVFEKREEARARGEQARRDMVSKYCPKCVSDLAAAEILRLANAVRTSIHDRNHEL